MVGMCGMVCDGWMGVVVVWSGEEGDVKKDVVLNGRLFFLPAGKIMYRGSCSIRQREWKPCRYAAKRI